MKRVFLIEGNAVFRHALAYVLQWREAFDTSCRAGSASEGYRYAREGKLEDIDVVVAEPLTANGSAFPLIRELRQAEPGVPILVLTLAGDDFSREKMLDQGADEVLTKEASVEEILAAIRRLSSRGGPEKD